MNKSRFGPGNFPAVEMTLLRIAQEGLTNVARRAQADQITLSLQHEENTIRLRIQDNGVGIESSQVSTRPGSHVGNQFLARESQLNTRL
jgi:signal transduction histidine kinase